ncbi:hypothetical protein [Streptomyces rubiginosohelvolus]|uniref:hypothetical protein n=1 Tax=Streptomyces rubiginosohelvolus TaxID=67362 RepID=UPI0035D538F3
MTTPWHRRTRLRAAVALTTTALTLLATTQTTRHLTPLLLATAAALGATTTTIALTATFARTAHRRAAADRTLDLLLRLVPWYTPRR